MSHFKCFKKKKKVFIQEIYTIHNSKLGSIIHKHVEETEILSVYIRGGAITQ